jgi:hypothetical protein
MNLADIRNALSSVDWGRASVIVTAIATLVLAIATVRLAGATRKSAKQTEKAVALQADELEALKHQGVLQADQLEVFKRQLTLAEDQGRQAESMWRPLLRALIGSGHESYTEVSLLWVHGVAPAQDIEVWVRTHLGLRVARHELMTPSDGQINVFAMPASADDVSERLPFEKLAHALPQPEQMWVGVDYRGPDGKLVGWSEWTRKPPQTIDDEGNVSYQDPRLLDRVKGPGPIERAK